jgi:hypothetical protein
LLGSSIPGKNEFEAIPYGYFKLWTTNRPSGTYKAPNTAAQTTLEMVRPGVLLHYGDWRFVYLAHVGRSEVLTLDAWLCVTPKDKALRRLEFGQLHIPSGWESRTSGSWIHTMNRSLVVTAFARSTYDKGIWTEWDNPWIQGGYLGVGVMSGSGINSADPDSQKDFMLGAKAPYGPWTFELTRYWGQGVPAIHFLEGMAQYSRGPWWGTAEYWTGARNGKHYDGAYGLLRYNIDGNLWTSNRWEYLTTTPQSGPSTKQSRATLGLSYELPKSGWRAMMNYEIWSGDSAPKNFFGAELQWRWYPWLMGR